MERADLIYFTQNGGKLAERIVRTGDGDFRAFTKPVSLREWTGERFHSGTPIIFIGAVGIAVRSIAPFIKDKLTDIPVLVMDETGKYVIPILSAHYGGGIALAKKLAALTGAEPVITTATDLNGCFSVDVFASENGFLISDKDEIKYFSSEVLKGAQICFWTEMPKGIIKEDKLRNIKNEICSDNNENKEGNGSFIAQQDAKKVYIIISPFRDHVHSHGSTSIHLIPKNIHVGIGCRSGKTYNELKSALKNALDRLNININAIGDISSIDVKMGEIGLLELCANLGIEKKFYGAEELKRAKGDFESSDFVEQTVGVGNVCERAAFLSASRSGGSIKLMGKTGYDGITVSVYAGEIDLHKLVF
ncbi:MAG: cobalamin biosynthesis protein [Lachnospiraceae bacterium]|nr:cobalamin biosynthesis protein [Lachnospiraceae bacterium]